MEQLIEHCGFRALALSVCRSEEHWRIMKTEMLRDMMARQQLYTCILGGRVQIGSMYSSLDHNQGLCAIEKWMSVPKTAIITATTNNVVMCVISSYRNGCYTYLPLSQGDPVDIYINHMQPAPSDIYRRGHILCRYALFYPPTLMVLVIFNLYNTHLSMCFVSTFGA